MASAKWGRYLVSRANLYLVLTVLGVVFPLTQLVPWLAEHGLDLPLLWHEIVASRISAFAWADVVVSVLVIIIFVVSEGRRTPTPLPWLPILGCLTIGASFVLPLFVYLREKQLENRA